MFTICICYQKNAVETPEYFVHVVDKKKFELDNGNDILFFKNRVDAITFLYKHFVDSDIKDYIALKNNVDKNGRIEYDIIISDYGSVNDEIIKVYDPETDTASCIDTYYVVVKYTEDYQTLFRTLNYATRHEAIMRAIPWLQDHTRFDKNEHRIYDELYKNKTLNIKSPRGNFMYEVTCCEIKD